MKIGSSYYPELSDRETWQRDLGVARDLGLKTLRCGEFAWSRFCRSPDEWDDSWAHDFLQVALDHGFDVVWCTPSATPPPALFDRWPDLQSVNVEGKTVPIGVRRNYCPSHPGYRDLCGETAGRLGNSLKAHPAVKGWQIDNEIAGDGFTCWCPRCGEAFQAWLEERYVTLEKLNQAWQTDVWSQRYIDWKQIPVPHKSFGAHMPALKLAYRRFRSDNWLAFYRKQETALRAAGVKQPITTNFFNLAWDIPFDQWAWRPHLDVIGLSHYIEDETGSRFELALLNGLDEKPLWVLEQKAGQQRAQNIYPENLDRIEGHLRACAEAGAEHAVYWHLRQHQAGCEMIHGAVLRHDGKATRVGRAIAAAVPVTSAIKPKKRNAQRILVFDFHQQWAQEGKPQAGTPWDYRKVLEQDWYGAMADVWGSVSMGPLQGALETGEIVAAPHFQSLDVPQLDLIRRFLQGGGTFVTTADFGWLNGEGNVKPLPPLGALADIIPVPDAEMLDLQEGFRVAGSAPGSNLSGGYFWLIPEGLADRAELLHQDQSGPAFLQYQVGAGRLIIFTSAFNREALKDLFGRIFFPSTTPPVDEDDAIGVRNASFSPAVMGKI